MKYEHPDRLTKERYEQLIKQDSDKYIAQVFDYMETLGVPDLVITYQAEDVANTFSNVIRGNYFLGLSFRMCAIVLWSLTMEKVMQDSGEAVKH